MGSQNLMGNTRAWVNRERSFKFVRDVASQCMKTQGSKREAKD